MTTEQLPPGPERRELMLGRGQNVSRRDFTDEEWAELGEQAARAAEVRRTTPGTTVPDLEAS